MTDEQQPPPHAEPPTEQPPSSLGIVLLAIGVEGGLILLAMLLGWWGEHPPLKTFRFDLVDALLGVAATVPMLVLFFVLLRWPIGPFARIKTFCKQILRPILAPCTLLDLAGISVLAGFGEEMLFRGVMQGYFSEQFPPWVALVIVSVLFGLMHAITLTYFIFATLMGLYLGLLWQLNGNLLLVIVTHALYDFIALVVIVRGDPQPELPLPREEREQSP